LKGPKVVQEHLFSTHDLPPNDDNLVRGQRAGWEWVRKLCRVKKIIASKIGDIVAKPVAVGLHPNSLRKRKEGTELNKKLRAEGCLQSLPPRKKKTT
jgi:hypothetical protein